MTRGKILGFAGHPVSGSGRAARCRVQAGLAVQARFSFGVFVAENTMSHHPMKRVRPFLAVLLLGIALLTGYLLSLQFGGNFHPILAGEAYRSAQPSAADLARWTTQNGIRSVINLRGRHVGAGWYDAEVDAARGLGLQHFDFGMSAGRQLSAPEAETLIALLRDAPKPVLIHCKSGADRTGLAAALYLAQAGHDEDRAEAQISIRYGHFSIPYTAAWPMDQTWEALEARFGYDS